MNTLNENPSQAEIKFNIFVLGFRPFFLAAGVFSIVSMSAWMAIYGAGLQIPMAGFPSSYWHAHEMLYGYTMAVVAGFLLTAIKNWTGQQTIQYTALLMLCLMWLGARACMLLGANFFIPAAMLDLGFNFCLLLAVLVPVFKVKQWRQAGIVLVVFLMALFNTLFYLGVFGVVDAGTYWGIYGALFLLLALVMIMLRRVMPFFIEKGLDETVQLKNSLFLDSASIVLFLLFGINEVFILDVMTSSYLALLLFIVSSARLYNWYAKGIWRKPLLWGIYSAFMVITLGFLLFALVPYVDVVTRSLSIHAFTLGGFGLLTLSMMSRVTLGHTGRGVKQPSSWITVAQWLLVMGVISRVVVPLFFQRFYLESVFMSQLLWIIGFAIFLVVNVPFLTKVRADAAKG